MTVVRDWDHFAELARASAKRGSIEPDLPAAADDLVALGYEKWSAEKPASAQRRTLEVFDAVLVGLYGDSIASLYRKVKGRIHPRGNELERLLTGIFVESGGDGMERSAAEQLASKLAALYLHRTPDLVAGTSDALVFASEARLVHGPDDHTRDETFRELMSNRLHAACVAMKSAKPLPLPLTIWAVDVTELCSDEASAADAYETRGELTVLAAALIRALERPLHPPREKPSLEFSSKPTIFSPDIRIALNPGGSEGANADLRDILLRTSVICFIGNPRTEDLGQSKLQIEGNVDGNFFRQALMPATFIDATRRSENSPNRAEIERVLAHASLRQISVASRLPFEQVRDIGNALEEDADLDVLQELAFGPENLDPQFYLYSYEAKSGDKGSAVSETPLQRFETPPAIRFALFALLCGATATLRKAYAEKACEEGSIGWEMGKLLASNHVEFLTVSQFLDLKHWPGIRGNILEDAGRSGKKDRKE